VQLERGQTGRLLCILSHGFSRRARWTSSSSTTASTKYSNDRQTHPGVLAPGQRGATGLGTGRPRPRPHNDRPLDRRIANAGPPSNPTRLQSRGSIELGGSLPSKTSEGGIAIDLYPHRCEVIDYRNDFLPPGLSIGRQRDMNDGWSSGPGAHCGQTVATVDDQLKVSTRSRINLRIEGLTSSASLLAGRPGGNSSLSAASPTRWTRLSMALSALIIAAPIVIWSRLLSIGACFGWAGRSLAGLPLGIGAGRS